MRRDCDCATGVWRFALGAGWNVWTQWQNLTFTGTSTLRSSTHNPSASWSVVMNTAASQQQPLIGMMHHQPLICRNIAHLVWYSACTNWEIPAVQRPDPWEMITWKTVCGLGHDFQASRVAGMWDATSPFWVPCDTPPHPTPRTLVQDSARFGVCRNLGQIITLLLSLQSGELI